MLIGMLGGAVPSVTGLLKQCTKCHHSETNNYNTGMAN